MTCAQRNASPESIHKERNRRKGGPKHYKALVLVKGTELPDLLFQLSEASTIQNHNMEEGKPSQKGLIQVFCKVRLLSFQTKDGMT